MARRESRHIQGALTVTNASVEVSAFTYDPRDVLIQNNHTTGYVYINLSGDAVADDESGMFIIKPGGSMEFRDISNAVSVMGNIASNAKVTLSTAKTK